MDRISIDNIKNIIIGGLMALLVIVSTYSYFVIDNQERVIAKKNKQIENLMDRVKCTHYVY